MRKILLLLFFLPMLSYAQSNVGGAYFGFPYDNCLANLKYRYGTPHYSDRDWIYYKNLTIGKHFYTQVSFWFQYYNGNHRLHKVVLRDAGCDTADEAKEIRESIYEIYRKKYFFIYYTNIFGFRVYNTKNKIDTGDVEINIYVDKNKDTNKYDVCVYYDFQPNDYKNDDI